MIWNWEQPGWPEFTFERNALEQLEQQFLLRSGEFIGAFKHIGPADRDVLKIELISDEAVQTSAIEGEDFLVAKAGLYEKLRGKLNQCQEKAMARMFREGIDGFKGGLSAENYIPITKASRATATRDLQDLVGKGALTKTGELRHTRYHLAIPGETAALGVDAR
jgi:Fic family protein